MSEQSDAKGETENSVKSWAVMPPLYSVNITVGNTVILALYDNGKFIEMQSRIYDGSDVTFKTDKPYTNAKVMVWESLENMKSVCGTEKVK